MSYIRHTLRSTYLYMFAFIYLCMCARGEKKQSESSLACLCRTMLLGKLSGLSRHSRQWSISASVVVKSPFVLNESIKKSSCL